MEVAALRTFVFSPYFNVDTVALGEVADEHLVEHVKNLQRSVESRAKVLDDLSVVEILRDANELAGLVEGVIRTEVRSGGEADE